MPSHPEPVGHLLRMVIDAVNECNLRCHYCHPGEVWRQQQLPEQSVRSALLAAEEAGILEVVLTGGEITLHSDLQAILESTHLLRRCASTLITNATKLTPEVIDWMAASNLTRVCTSVDGATNEVHGTARGKNLPKVLTGLRLLKDTGKPITVITVVHQQNWRHAIELSDFLATEKLATQHHLCAPSFSGQARSHYPKLALNETEFHQVQQLVDSHFGRLRDHGLYLTFNSHWPATGRRTLTVNPRRTITLQQLSEQVKDVLCNVRPNGEFRLQAATWGREMVGNAIIGSVHAQPVSQLIAAAESTLTSGTARQLPRVDEARHKFQIGARANIDTTNILIGHGETSSAATEMIPILSVDEHWLLDNPADLATVRSQLVQDRDNHRVARHPTGRILVFDRRRSLITLLHEQEWQQVETAYAAGSKL
ncbi:radical SAM protein [Nocardia uniformis]|uniref:Radical SAM protein n=1 Tax=Nocardia uniformis TaxID=53432 RepID=A0A849BS55_9NOCA|nr:radical SAM protein [Nocardia uniformis]NNH69433.1 radical SAM protein [Nocardia uniformis]